MWHPRIVSIAFGIWVAAGALSSGCGEPEEVADVERQRTSDRRAFVAGRVVGADGEHVTGASITVHSRDPAGYVHRVESGPSGGYLFAHVPFGVYRIRVSAAGYRSQEKLLRVDGMEERSDFQLEMPPRP